MCNVGRQKASRRNARSAFTLIELLVVIAILALLISILLPSLSSARRQAKHNVCLSRIRNISTSSLIYESGDENGWGIPVHPRQYWQDPDDPTYIGAYEWGGKSGIGRQRFVSQYAGTVLGSKYGTAAGFGPATRPLNRILYPGGFSKNYDFVTRRLTDRHSAEADTKLDLDMFRCPADDGPPKGAHCADWVDSPNSSYDHFGTSYAANIFMICCERATGNMFLSNSPYLRPFSRVPNPARTLYYEENIGRWAWACKRERCSNQFLPGIEPNYWNQPDTGGSLRGWHGRDWTYNRSFLDGHAEYQRIIEEGTEDKGYAFHYRIETIYESGHEQNHYSCVTIRGDGWQKDTLPSPPITTGLHHVEPTPRPSYEDCVR